jgi:hypothetical protein
MRLWVTGQPEWQLSAEAPRLIWESGVDAAFLGSAVAFVVFGAGALWAYREVYALRVGGSWPSSREPGTSRDDGGRVDPKRLSER